MRRAPAALILRLRSDQAIIENASGRQTLLASLRGTALQLFTRPGQFFTKPAFLLLWGVYGGTYTAANVINTTCDKVESTSATRGASKFVGVSCTNLVLNISKDAIFTKMFAAYAAGRHDCLGTCTPSLACTSAQCSFFS